MESEKVKEIKDYIQKSADLGQYYMLAGGKITMMEVVNYINELESENERLRLERDVLIGKKIAEKQKNDKALIMKIDIQEQLKDRIAELEKENATKTDTIVDLLNKQEIYEKEKLTKFAERLKEDFTKKKNKLIKEREIAIKYDDFILIDALAYKIDELQYAIDNIDETLKEFTT